MVKSHGWAGTILDVDLARGKIERQQLSTHFAEKYIGGIGFNAAKLFDLVRPKTDALSPENAITVSVGPLAGTLYPGSTRFTISAKSPLTDAFGSTNCGGFLGAELKSAGYDQIAISGKAEKPVYLWVDDEEVQIRDATHLWGMSTWETGRRIREEHGDPEIPMLVIGPAGENLVRFASVISPPRGAGGRGGMGAVMGSKNLKAIAVRGTNDVTMARPEEFFAICKDSTIFGRGEGRYKYLRGGGSSWWTELGAKAGTLGVRNYSKALFPGYTDVSGEKFEPGKELTVRKRACFSCPVGCGGFSNVRAGEFQGTFGPTPENGMTSISAKCDFASAPAILEMQRLFDEYGIDALSGGYMLSWAMDCYGRGILGKEDCDGISLDWGNYVGCIELIPKIARREGLGGLLAEGEKRAPQKLGKGSEKLMYHVKGMAIPSPDPRSSKFFALGCVTSPRGSDHLTANVTWVPDLLRKADSAGSDFWKAGRGIAEAYVPYLGENPFANREKWEVPLAVNRERTLQGMGEALKVCEDISAIINALEVCTRSGGSLEFMAKALSAATGVDFGIGELLEAGERIFNMEKAFNAREGMSRKDDNFSVPEKFIADPVADGPHKGDTFSALDRALDDYYRARGWDPETGLQTKALLERLGLGQVIQQLEKTNAFA